MEAALSKFAEMIPPMIKTAKTLYDTLKPYAPLLAGLAGSIGTLMLVKSNAAFTAWQKQQKDYQLRKRYLIQLCWRIRLSLS